MKFQAAPLTDFLPRLLSNEINLKYLSIFLCFVLGNSTEFVTFVAWNLDVDSEVIVKH